MRIDISRVNLLEKDIEEYLYQNPRSVFFSYSNGEQVRVTKWIFRQFEVPSGIIDLVGELEDGRIAVVEVKLGVIDGKAIAQVCRYAKDIESIVYWAVRNFEAVDVMRFVIGDSLSDKALFECEAMQVIPLTFRVELNLATAQTAFNPDYTEQLKETYKSLSTHPEIMRIQRAYEESVNDYDENADGEGNDNLVVVEDETTAIVVGF